MKMSDTLPYELDPIYQEALATLKRLNFSSYNEKDFFGYIEWIFYNHCEVAKYKSKKTISVKKVREWASEYHKKCMDQLDRIDRYHEITRKSINEKRDEE